MVEAAENRVAVYIDFDNIVISRYDEVFGRGKFMLDKARNAKIPEAQAVVDVGAILDYATSFGSVLISRAFADWSAPANSFYSRQLVDRAVDLVQMFPTTGSYQKNGADIRLAVDVVEDMFGLPDITHVVIVSGDSDFIPLAQSANDRDATLWELGLRGRRASLSRLRATSSRSMGTFQEWPRKERPNRPRKLSLSNPGQAEPLPNLRRSRRVWSRIASSPRPNC
jgi:hypothetical protein